MKRQSIVSAEVGAYQLGKFGVKTHLARLGIDEGIAVNGTMDRKHKPRYVLSFCK